MDLSSKYNYYDILEVGTQAPQHEVTSAYERMKTTYNTDNPAIYTIFSAEEARQMLSLVEEAYSILGNKGLRHQYDATLAVKSDKTQESQPPAFKARPQDSAKKNVFDKPQFTVDKKLEDEVSNLVEWTGPWLRKVREYRNWKVEDLAERTKISSYYITAIENEDPKNLPAPVYVRGYLSQLCKVFFLDEKRVCDSYMKMYKQKIENKP